MSYELWIKAAELGMLVIQAALVSLIFVLRSTFASKGDVRQAHARADAAHHQIDLIRKDIAGLPDYDKFNKLAEAITALDKHLTERHGELRGLSDKVDDLRDMVRTLDDIVRQIK